MGAHGHIGRERLHMGGEAVDELPQIALGLRGGMVGIPLLNDRMEQPDRDDSLAEDVKDRAAGLLHSEGRRLQLRNISLESEAAVLVAVKGVREFGPDIEARTVLLAEND